MKLGNYLVRSLKIRKIYKCRDDGGLAKPHHNNPTPNPTLTVRGMDEFTARHGRKGGLRGRTGIRGGFRCRVSLGAGFEVGVKIN